ncbi:hypothetical protein EMPG_14597 [Blastomyces silverae]|uniref:Uncharacterized protein n=1 Tax=Blastomyces silverae TaxID=2060906 RepID=A0A0H1BF46_9EURO|nr:hypothetical protein EMPG_14597 [Blastomyces silverae]
MLWVIAGETESFSTNALLALYMKSHPTNSYSVPQLNNYPTGRYLVGYWIGITGIVTSAMILVPGSSTATIFGAYYWAGSVYACQATFFAWANDVMRYKDDAMRSIVIASMNMGSNVVNAWWALLFYSADQAPFFTKGMWAMIACSIAMAIWTAGIVYFSARDEKQEEARMLEEDVPSKLEVA